MVFFSSQATSYHTLIKTKLEEIFFARIQGIVHLQRVLLNSLIGWRGHISNVERNSRQAQESGLAGQNSNDIINLIPTGIANLLGNCQ